MTLKTRLVAYEPGGDQLGYPLKFTSWSAGFVLDDVSAADIVYPDDLDTAGLFDRPIEVALEVGRGEDWTEPPNARFLSAESSTDLAAPIPITTTTLRGLGSLLERVEVLRQSENAAGLPYDSEGKRNFTGVTVGQLVLSIVEESRAKYPNMLAGISLGFTQTKDSKASSWDRQVSIAYEPGTDLLRILEDLVSRGDCEWYMQGRALKIMNAGGGATHDWALLLEDTTDAPLRTTWENLATHIAVDGGDGAHWVEAVDGADVPYGAKIRRIGNDSITTNGTAQALITTEKAQALSARREVTRTLARLDPAPLRDFQVGDWVRADLGDGLEDVRVFAVTLSWDSGRLTAALTLNDRFVDAALRDAKRLSGITHGTTQILGDGGIPSAADTAAPAVPLGLVANSLGYWDGAVARASVLMSWQPVTHDVHGNSISVSGYEALIGSSHRRTVSGTTAEFDRLAVGQLVRVYVRAISGRGVKGDWAGPVPITTGLPPDQLNPPTKPDLQTGLGSISITWDGKLQGSGQPHDPPAHFSHVEVETLEEGETEWTRWPQNSGFVHVGLPAGDLFEVRLVAVDTLGSESAPSPISTITVTSKVDEALAAASDAALEAEAARNEAEAAVTGAGEAVATVQTEYAVSTSSTVAPTSGWTNAGATRQPGQVIWARTKTVTRGGAISYGSPAPLTGDTGDQGEPGAGIEIAGSVDAYSNLPGTLGSAEAGEAYLVRADGLLYIWDGQAWPANGFGVEFRGPAGPAGASGSDGADGRGVVSVTTFYRTLPTQSAAPTSPTTHTPAEWTDTEPGYIAGNKLYTTARTDYSDDTWAWGPVQVSSAYSAAMTALQSADGKSTTYYQDAQPDSPSVGDRWYQISTGAGFIYSGTGWRSTVPGDGFVPALDIGSGTAGYMEVNRLTAGSGQFSSAVIERLVTNQTFARAVAAESIVVGGGNFLKNTDFTRGWVHEPSGGAVTPSAYTGPGGTPSAQFHDDTTGHGGICLGRTNPEFSIPPLEPGTELVLSAWISSYEHIPAGRLALGLVSMEGGYSLEVANQSAISPHNPVRITGAVTVPSQGGKLAFCVMTNMPQGDMWISSPSVTRRLDTISLRHGAVTAPIIAAKSIEAEHMSVGALDSYLITSPKIQTVSASNRGIKLDTQGFRAYNSSGQQTVSITPAGKVQIAGELTTGLSGNRVVVSPDGHFLGQPGLNFESGSTAGDHYAEIFFTPVTTGEWARYTLALIGSETVRNSSGRSTLKLEHNGDFSLREAWGSNREVGFHKEGTDVQIKGRLKSNEGDRPGLDTIISYRPEAGSDTFTNYWTWYVTWAAPSPWGTRRTVATPAGSSAMSATVFDETLAGASIRLHNLSGGPLSGMRFRAVSIRTY